MRWLITLLLSVLVAGGGAVLFFGDTVLPALGLRTPPPPPSPVLTEVEQLRPEKVTKVELLLPGKPAMVFERKAGVWVQPADNNLQQMDLRQDEVNELVTAVATLRTRYQPFPTEEGVDYGFRAAPGALIQVKVTTAAKKTTVAFAQPKGSAGEPAFARPAYVRIDDATDFLRVGPDVLATVARPPETYLRRQLFADAKRVKFNDPVDRTQTASDARKLLFDDAVKSVEISGPDGTYTLTRAAPNPAPRRDPARTGGEEPVMLPVSLADSWKVNAKIGDSAVEDRVDPAKLKTILTAIPDLWAEKFVDPEPLADLFTDYFRQSAPALMPSLLLQNADRQAMRDHVLADLTGFTRDAMEKQKKAIEAGTVKGETKAYDPERVVTVTRTDNRKVVLRIGAVSRVAVRKEMTPPMGMFPPSEREVRTEFRYAKFDGNPRVFEVKGEKINDVFVKADDLRDPKLVQFAADEVSAVTVTTPRTFAVAAAGGIAALSDKPLSQVTLTRVKGKPTAATEKGKKDRWFLGDRLAEAAEVTALLEALTKLETKSAEDRPYAIAPPGIPTTVALTVEPKVADGDEPLPKKEFTFTIAGREVPKNAPPFGRPPTAKLAVKVDGWARLNWTELPAPAGPMAPPPGPAADDLALRSATTYRSRQLFDTADSSLDRVTVTPDAAAFTSGFPGALGGFFGIAPPPAPTAFEVQSPAGDGKWALAAPLATPADEAAAPKLATDLSELKSVEEIADAPTAKQLAEFGLTKPRLAVELGFRGTDARTETLSIGADRPDKSEVYARLKNGGVFTIPKSVVEPLTGGAEALLPKQLWTVPTDKITAIGIRRLNEEKKEEAYALTAFDAGQRKWSLTGPFQVVADTKQAEDLAAGVANLKAIRYEPLALTDALRAKHGLAAPAVRVTLTSEDAGKTTTRTLLVGNKTKPDAAERFAKIDGEANAAVFVVPDSLFAAADKSAVGFLDRKMLALEPSLVTKVQLSGPTPEANVALTNDGKAWKPEGAAFPVDVPTVQEIMAAATKLTALRIEAYGPNVNTAKYGFDKPTHTLTLTVKGEPAPVVIQLGKEEPSGERYVRVEGKPAVGVVSGFVAAYLTRGKLDVIDRGLFSFDPSTVTGVTRKKGAEEFELAPAGRAWEVAKPMKFKADKPTVEALAADVGFLRAVKVQAFAPADLKPFGLDAPAAVVTFKADGKDYSLKLGKPVDDAKPTGDRFAAVEGSQVVAVVPGALANRLLADPVKFSDRTLNPNRFVDADKVVIDRDGRAATFAKVDGVWRLTAPAAQAETAEMEDLIAAAAQLRAEELVANNPTPAQLKEFGFDPPQARIVISNADKELLTLLVGAKEKTGPRVHVKLEKGNLVGLLDPTTSSKVTAEYRARAAWPAVDAAQIEALGLSGDGTDFALRKEGMAWTDGGKPADANVVADTLAVLAGLKAEWYVADKDAKLPLYGLDKPKRVIVLTLKGGDKRVLHVGNPVGGPAGKQVYAKVDEKDRTDVFVLSEADTAKLLLDRKAFGGK